MSAALDEKLLLKLIFSFNSVQYSYTCHVQIKSSSDDINCKSGEMISQSDAKIRNIYCVCKLQL